MKCHFPFLDSSIELNAFWSTKPLLLRMINSTEGVLRRSDVVISNRSDSFAVSYRSSKIDLSFFQFRLAFQPSNDCSADIDGRFVGLTLSQHVHCFYVHDAVDIALAQ